TFTILTTSEGKKMGKTEKGALWLDPEKVTPYEFYQYWRNVDDKDVIRLLKLVTFVPMEEIAEYEKLEGQQLNTVKERLAYEVTKMVHGEDEANKAQTSAKAVFGAGADDSNMPTFELPETEINAGLNIVDLLAVSGLAPSKGEARRLVQQGGVSIDGNKIDDIAYIITKDIFTDGKIVVKKGKKVFLKIVLA
ncbi:MAG: tyrosine--tRNA ligase, partial [Clostridia bacterium]|nr:tyrosine--tRNA ligase [Clostridia bacterium]